MSQQNIILFDASTARYALPPSPDEVEQLYDKLSYKIDGAEFAPQAKKFIFDPRTRKMVYNKRFTGWDGVKRLYDKKTNSFPIGLIHRAVEITPNVMLKPLVEMIERKPFSEFSKSMLYKPHRHQIVAFEKLIERGHAMVELPTASGKSWIIAALAMSMRDSIGLITVPSKYLLHQTRKDIESLTKGKLQLGIYGDGECDLRQITIATVQSLDSGSRSRGEILAWMNEVGWWVADETHGAAADSWQEAGHNLCKAMVRYGLTATCRREDNSELLLEGVIGPLIYKEDASTLVKENVLAVPEIEIHHFDPGSISGNYPSVYKQAVVDNDARNNKILDQVTRAIRDNMCPMLIIVDAKKHGKDLAKMIQDSGIDTESIDGDDPTKKRDAAVTKLLSGAYPVLVASGIFTTGINIPPIRTVLNAAAGKSVTETIQRAGRGLRQSPSTGKTKCRVIDFFDEEYNYLRRHAAMRERTYLTTYPGYVKIYLPDGEEDGL
jgi:superfamily II DNA or RNA helicase